MAILPFTAGSNIEANDGLDKIALMIVKGSADTIEGRSSPLKVVTAENANRVDLIIEGHITDMSAPSKLGRWVLGKKNKALSVSGKVIERKTGDTLAIFTHSKQTKNKKAQFEDLGYAMGEDIARFVLSGTQ